jgi:hypothetical protein
MLSTYWMRAHVGTTVVCDSTAWPSGSTCSAPGTARAQWTGDLVPLSLLPTPHRRRPWHSSPGGGVRRSQPPGSSRSPGRRLYHILLGQVRHSTEYDLLLTGKSVNEGGGLKARPSLYPFEQNRGIHFEFGPGHADFACATGCPCPLWLLTSNDQSIEREI